MSRREATLCMHNTHTLLPYMIITHTIMKPPCACRMDYFGVVVNRTARIMSVAAPGETAISTNTESFLSEVVREAVIIKSIGNFALKGDLETD